MDSPAQLIQDLREIAQSVDTSSILQTQDRVTATLTIHHEHQGEGPVGAEFRFSNMLESFGEQPENRRIKVTNKWTPLKFAYLEDSQIGYIVIDNGAGRNLMVLSTQEEKDLHSRQVVRLMINKSVKLVVRPGRFILVEIEHDKKHGPLQIKCDVGTCNVKVWAFPK